MSGGNWALGVGDVIIGHRGAAAHAPENTLAGLRKAASLGVGWVEVDANLTADGVCVLLHDATLDRTTDRTGARAELSWEQVAQADAGAWFGAEFAGERIPTLLAAIAELARLGLGANIEIKPSAGRQAAVGRAVARICAREWPRSLPPPVLSSFSVHALRAAAAVAPQFPRAILVGRNALHWRRRSALVGADALHIVHQAVRPAVVLDAHRAMLPVRCFTVNDPDRAAQLLDWGVDSIFTDDPPALMRSL